MDPVEVSFAGAMGAALGLLIASFLHIPWLELPLMLAGLSAGAAIAFFGVGVLPFDLNF